MGASPNGLPVGGNDVSAAPLASFSAAAMHISSFVLPAGFSENKTPPTRRRGRLEWYL